MDSVCTSVEEYIQTFPKDVQIYLSNIRNIIKATAPTAVESISYGIPSYKINGKPLIYFAAFKKHIGLYALPSGHLEFVTELSRYKQGKGSVQFPLNKTIPYDLIKRIVTFRVTEIEAGKK